MDNKKWSRKLPGRIKGNDEKTLIRVALEIIKLMNKTRVIYSIDKNNYFIK